MAALRNALPACPGESRWGGAGRGQTRSGAGPRELFALLTLSWLWQTVTPQRDKGKVRLHLELAWGTLGRGDIESSSGAP